MRSLLGSSLVNLLLGTLYQSTNSVKHQQRRHFVFGVFTVIWSMWTGIHPARLRTLVVGRDIPCKSTLQAVEKILPTIEIDTLEYQQTEKIETELKDVDRIHRIRKVYAS